jgi:predicted DNA-binding protein (MmcQ/YjbR family)
MNVEEIREYAISKPDVEESFPFGPETLVFKIAGKVFLLMGLDSDPLQFNVKCDPERAIELRDEYECIVPGYHMNKKHWNSVIIDGTLTNKKIKEQIDHSYDLVKPKPKRK